MKKDELKAELIDFAIWIGEHVLGDMGRITDIDIEQYLKERTK